MLYIKFNILNPEKYNDFQKLYKHMVKVRQPKFVFENELEPQIDWDSLNADEVEIALQKLDDYNNPDKFTFLRYKDLIPSYAQSFIAQYINNTEIAISKSDAVAFMDYLEYNFEVHLDNLEEIEPQKAVVKFSTGNYPFGGLDQFIITLKAYELVPMECFNDFYVVKFNWGSDFEYETIELAHKIALYLKK